MRKILMFGTMLSVASAALAFGGMFGSSGHKSTTYKGGVDAIGVHFGGEKETTDSQPGESGCPTEKQCGEYCCQMDNICHQDSESGEYQCCDKDLTHCCPAMQGVYDQEDWSMGYPPRQFKACCEGKIYCEQDAEGNCVGKISCCPSEKILYGPFERGVNDYKAYVCCSGNDEVFINGKFSYGNSYSCCPSTAKVYKGVGKDGADYCCYAGELVCAEYDENENCLYYTCR